MTRPNRQRAIVKQLVKAHRALAAAEHDLQGGYPDAAASRAYYCVFHGARAALLTVGVQPKTHRGVNERFNMDLVLPGKIEAEYLSILGREQTERETADYSVDEEISETEGRALVSQVRRFLERVARFLKDDGWALPDEG